MLHHPSAVSVIISYSELLAQDLLPERAFPLAFSSTVFPCHTEMTCAPLLGVFEGSVCLLF